MPLFQEKRAFYCHSNVTRSNDTHSTERPSYPRSSPQPPHHNKHFNVTFASSLSLALQPVSNLRIQLGCYLHCAHAIPACAPPILKPDKLLQCIFTIPQFSAECFSFEVNFWQLLEPTPNPSKRQERTVSYFRLIRAPSARIRAFLGPRRQMICPRRSSARASHLPQLCPNPTHSSESVLGILRTF